MGLLLKEALRTLCGVNQWCYAVFWKIGCQNTKLLIWEECYFRPTPSSESPFGKWEGCWDSSELHSSQLRAQAGDSVRSLTNKMMMNNHVSVVGEGIIGRAAFTGNHHWILVDNYIKDAHPSEVLNEVQLQFAGGMKTVAVIPVLPHGVVQLGSPFAIMENIGFVKDVKSLVLQLGCVPGALLSDNYGANESTEKIGIPVSLATQVSMNPSRNFNPINSSPLMSDGCNKPSDPVQPSRIADQPPQAIGGHILDNLQNTASTLPVKSHTDHFELKPSSAEIGPLGSGRIPALDVWLKQQNTYSLRHGFNCQPNHVQPDVSHDRLKLMEQQILSDVGVQDQVNSFLASQMETNGGVILNSHGQPVSTPMHNGSGLHNRISVPSISHSPIPADNNHSCANLAGVGCRDIISSKAEEVPSSSMVDHVTGSCLISRDSIHRKTAMDVKHNRNVTPSVKQRVDSDLFQAFDTPSLSEQLPSVIQSIEKHDSGNTSTSPQEAKYEVACVQRSSGDDLFDILGMDFKNKLLNSSRNKLMADGQYTNAKNLGKDTSMLMNMQDIWSLYAIHGGPSDSDIFSEMGSDNLLDAVVSRAHSTTRQISDDNVSCGTTVTKISSSSVPSTSPNFGQVNMSNHMQAELLGLHKSLDKAVPAGSSSFRSGCSRDSAKSCSQTTSIYGSQISSLFEQGHNIKRENSVSTAYSKKNDDVNKSNRKRLKPGENPRPRPKDRQMIQDRVKELREIVPNGAKCSIDALLERTIKHMLFLQSVTKHADNLKQTGESKIINKEGGLLLKDNFEGGATWAFEVGSQSMVCPIIVEDLNPPRQMLVEMLCEERGFFLEIADLIRGLGLTILKGVMEARNDKIWARFAVEANRDVTRMEIFMSLVRLLEQTVKGGTSSANGLDNNMIGHHSYSQAASIPATGRPNSLQ